MGHPVGGHGIGAGHCVITAGYNSGQQRDKQLVGHAVAVRQGIDSATLGESGVVQAYGPSVGDSPQKTLLHMAGLFGLPAGDFPAQNAAGPLGQLLSQGVCEQNGALILHNVRSRV